MLGKENVWAVAKKPENEKFDGFQKIKTPVSKTCLIQNSKRMRKKQEIENRLLFSTISKNILFLCFFGKLLASLEVPSKTQTLGKIVELKISR